MKVLSIIEPWATLIASKQNTLKHVAGKHHTEESYIYMQAKKHIKDKNTKIAIIKTTTTEAAHEKRN